MNVQPDVMLVIGLVIAVLSIPAVVSALSNGRAPRVAMLTVMIGGGMIVWALMNKPGGYAIAEIPTVFAHVIAQAIR